LSAQCDLSLFIPYVRGLTKEILSSLSSIFRQITVDDALLRSDALSTSASNLFSSVIICSSSSALQLVAVPERQQSRTNRQTHLLQRMQKHQQNCEHYPCDSSSPLYLLLQESMYKVSGKIRSVTASNKKMHDSLNNWQKPRTSFSLTKN
jgi:hypothetical protein